MGKDETLAVALVVCALLACKSSEQRTTDSKVAATRAAPSETAPPTKAPRVEVAKLAQQLDVIMRDPKAHATGTDHTGEKTVTFHLKPLDGIGLAYFVVVRGQKKAWRFGLEGIRCDRLGELGLELLELHRGDGRPLSASWYRVKGGPLEGVEVKTFPGDEPGLCTILPGTPPYWDHQGEKPPKR